MDKKELIEMGLHSVKSCIAKNDVYTALVLLGLCKYVAGKEFKVNMKFSVDYVDESEGK